MSEMYAKEMKKKLDEVQRFVQWKAEFLELAVTRYSDVYSYPMLATIDWEAYKEYYDDGLTPEEAIFEDISAMQDSQ